MITADANVIPAKRDFVSVNISFEIRMEINIEITVIAVRYDSTGSRLNNLESNAGNPITK